MLTLPEHPSFWLVSCNLIFSFICICFVDRCLFFFILAIVLSVLRFTGYYPGIFKLFFISCDEMKLLLGIDIDYQLNFDKPIKDICHKSFAKLSVLKRIECYFFYLSKLTISHTFILSIFNFCPSLNIFVETKYYKTLKKKI